MDRPHAKAAPATVAEAAASARAGVFSFKADGSLQVIVDDANKVLCTEGPAAFTSMA